MCVLLVETYNDDKFERFDPDVDPLQRSLIWRKRISTMSVAAISLRSNITVKVKISDKSNSFECPDSIKLSMTRLIRWRL